MQAAFNQTFQLIGTYIPKFAGAIVILIVGWLIALLLSAITRSALRRTELDNLLMRWVLGEEVAKKVEVERQIAKGVYYLILLFVLVAFFQVLGLTIITEPLNRFLVAIFAYAPRLLAGGLLLLIAWAAASIIRLVISRILSAADIDTRLSDQAGLAEKERLPLSKTISNALYWLIFLLFLPAVLDALALEGLLDPVQEMLSRILAFLPNIFAAFLILIVGWFFARILQRITANLLASVGIDGLSERVGLNQVLGKQRLSQLLGLIVYILIFIPILVAALDALALKAITQPASSMLNKILVALPAIFAASLVIIVAYVVGRVVAELAKNLLTSLGFDNILVRIGLTKEPIEGKQTPSEILGYLVLVAIMLLAAMEAFRLLGFTLLGDLTAQFILLLGHIAAGLFVFALGLYLASLASQAVLASGSEYANLLALITRISIWALAGAIALHQMGVANQIINLAFGILLGAIAVAAALAFGLGGREVASRQIEEWLKSIKSKKSTD